MVHVCHMFHFFVSLHSEIWILILDKPKTFTGSFLSPCLWNIFLTSRKSDLHLFLSKCLFEGGGGESFIGSSCIYMHNSTELLSGRLWKHTYFTFQFSDVIVTFFRPNQAILLKSRVSLLKLITLAIVD